MCRFVDSNVVHSSYAKKESKRYSPIDNFESTTLKFSVISPAFKESKPQGSASDCAALSFIVYTVEYDSFD